MSHSPSGGAIIVASYRPALRGAVFKAVSEGVSIATHGDRATRGGFSRSSDGEGRYSEVGYKVTIVSQSKGITCIGGNHIAVFSPINKGVTRVGRCGHCAGRTCGEGTATCDSATIGRVGSNIDSVFRSCAGHLKGGNIRDTLLTRDHNHHAARGHRSDRHVDSARRRHHSHTNDFVILSDSNIRTRDSAHREIGGSSGEGRIMADHIGVRNLMERHHRAIT